MSGWIVRPAVVLLLSTAVGAGQERSGTLHVTLDETTCRDIDQVVAFYVTTLSLPSGGKTVSNEVAGSAAPGPECAWSLAGLRPGNYEVWFQRNGKQVGSRSVAILPGRAAAIRFDADTVVSGAVIFNGEPFQGVTITFTQRAGASRQTATSVTDAAGMYQVTLPSDGPYTVEFSRDRTIVLGQAREGQATIGNNRTDWLLEGGTIRMMPVGWDHKASVLLLIERKGARSGIFGVGVYADAEHLPLTLTGLGYGTYQMRWMDDEKHARVSDEHEVTLDATNRDVSLKLEVTPPPPLGAP